MVDFYQPNCDNVDKICVVNLKNIGDKKMKIQVILEPSDEGGFTVTVPSLPGCISEGNTKEETLKNIKEAVELYLEPVDDDLRFNPDAQILEIAL